LIDHTTAKINTTIMEPQKRSMAEPDKNATVNEKKKMKPKRHLCVFTSASSTLQGNTDYPVCNAGDEDSALGKDVLMATCQGCRAWHCVECYADFHSYKHSEGKNIYRPAECPSVATFLDMKWSEVVGCKNNDAADKNKVEGLVEGTALSVVSDHSSIFHLEWNRCCPSCYDFMVPTIPLQITEFLRAEKPETDFFMWALDLIDPSTGGTIQTEVCLVVLSFSPVLIKEGIDQFMYRSADEILNDNHDTCRTILPKRPSHLNPDTQFRLLSRGCDTGDMLSFIHVGCLDPHFKSTKVSHATSSVGPFDIVGHRLLSLKTICSYFSLYVIGL
jgi:hypothetical protein